MVRGGVLQYGFRKYFMQWFHFGWRQNDARACVLRTFRISREQYILASHGITPQFAVLAGSLHPHPLQGLTTRSRHSRSSLFDLTMKGIGGFPR